MNRHSSLPRLLATIYVAGIVLLSVIAPAASAQYTRATVSLNLVAVVGDDQGEIVPATVTVTPGGFNVELKANGNTGRVLNASTWMAVAVGSLYAGVDWNTISVTITLETNGDVEGPSGSVAIALATYLALTRGNYSLSDYAITGAIGPGGSSTRVGGVDIKCKTAMTEGLTLVYPLANITPKLAEQCNGVPVATILDAAWAVSGLPPGTLDFKIPVPGEFNETMRQVAYNLSEQAIRVSRETLGYVPDIVQAYVNESMSLVDSYPYAAASRGYAALLAAYTEYYQSRQDLDVQGEAARIRGVLAGLQDKLDGMDWNGSIFYIEFLATAYTRLAEAEATLEELAAIASPNPVTAARMLAQAEARAETVKSWIATAERLRDVGPLVSQAELEAMISRFGQFTRMAAEYSNSMLDYMIQVYNVPEEDIKPIIDSLNWLLSEAERYAAEGNSVAALGFYRQALSRSLMLFSTALEGQPMDVIEGYYKGLTQAYSLLHSRLAATGLVSGLALAYVSYAQALKDTSPPVAVAMMQEAIASVIPWYTLLLKSAQPLEQGQATGGAGVQLDDVTVSVITVAASYVLGVTLTMLALRRGMKAP